MKTPIAFRTFRFRRCGVAEQVASALRDAIARGDLGDPLPGEYQFARELGIGRRSVRAALAQLASEGVVVVRKRHRTRVASTRRPRSDSGLREVCVVCPFSRDTAFFAEHPVLLEMHALFASRGVGWSDVFDARLAGPRPSALLQHIVAGRRDVCWILFGATDPIKRWFASAGVSAFVIGTCSSDIGLPAVDVNFGAVGWHAAGMLLNRGHRKIALVVSSNPFPGEIACRNEFLRYIAQRTDGSPVVELVASENLSQFRDQLYRLLRDPGRPSAVFALGAHLTLRLLTSLSGLSLRIPEDLSVVSRDSDRLLEMAVPELARYGGTTMKLATRAVRIAMKILAGAPGPTKASLVTPVFVPGSTLRTCD